MASAGALSGLLLAVGVEFCRVMFGKNFHTVVPGRVYRCAQLSGEMLRSLLQDYRIRTVINLRGFSGTFPWYLEEARATHAGNVAQEDVCFSAGRLPSTRELRRFIDVLDRCEYPILLHCRRGADRTGMAAAIVLLLETDLPLDRACRQLGIRYGHLALGRPASLDRFFELYQEWLDHKKLTHSKASFRRWATEEYCPGECLCRVEPLELPRKLARNQPTAMRIRYHNIGIKAWQLQPETNAGIHGRYVLWDQSDVQIASGRAGLFDGRVGPGQTVDLTFALPALREAGRYRLLIDLVDEQQCWFFQTGSEPLETEFEVCE
jgi:hypothetical protein